MHIIDSEKMHPEAVMSKDARLLEELSEDGVPLLHFYEWSVPCLTVGHFIDPGQHLDLRALAECGLQAAKRPTGGGIIFHLSDFAFSVLIPAKHPAFSHNTLANYAWINRRVADAISEMIRPASTPSLLIPEKAKTKESASFCMSRPTPYDLIIDGKKGGGAAQRRTKKGLLHQATLSLSPPPVEILRRVLKDQKIIPTIVENSYCLMPDLPLDDARKKIKELLTDKLCLEF